MQINDDSDEEQTFGHLRMKTIRSAQNLLARGYKSKQVFGIVAENVAHLSPIVFASLCLGCPINTLNTGVEKASLIRSFKVTEPSVVFCDVKVYDLVAECLTQMGSNVKVFTFNGTKRDSEQVENLFMETGIEEDFVYVIGDKIEINFSNFLISFHFRPVEIDGTNHIAAVMSSSGTTGDCKG